MITKILKDKDWKTKSRNMILNGEVSKFTKTFRNNFTTLLVSALGLVAALSWNDAIKEGIVALFPGENSVVYRFYLAITITIVSITATYFLSKIKTE